MKSIGYQWLIERFNLKVCDLLTKSFGVPESRMKEVDEGGERKLYYPLRRVSVDDTWQGNLVFAILFVRQNNGKLSAAKRIFFPELSKDEIAQLESVINA